MTTTPTPAPSTPAEVLRRVIAARGILLLDDPFFGVPALRLKVVIGPRVEPDARGRMPTAWTDGTHIGFNPAFVDSLNARQLAGLWAHEAMHCMMGHPWRREAREPYQWNEACDRAINPVLRESKFTLPPDVLYELAPEHFGKSAEWIFARLPKPEPSPGGASPPQPGARGPHQPSGSPAPAPGGASAPGASSSRGGVSTGGNRSQHAAEPGRGAGGAGTRDKDSYPNGTPDPGNRAGNGPGRPAAEGNGPGQGGHGPPDGSESLGQAPQGPATWGEVKDAPDTVVGEDGTEQPANTEEDWRELMQQAAAMARGQGKLAGGLARAVQAATRTKFDWKAAMRRFAQERAREDYSWRRPNPRYLPMGAYLPALYNEGMGPIVVGVDSSGSIDNVLLAQFVAELQAVADEVQPRRVTVLTCDAKIHRSVVFERGEPIEIKDAPGGGGTDFRPVFDAVAKLEEPPACVIYFTDLWGTFPEKDPGVETLWVTWTEKPPAVPFGEVVYANT